MYRIGIVVLGFVISSHAFAFDCSSLAPTPPTNVDTSYTGKVNAKVDGLFAKLLPLGGELDGAYHNIATNVLSSLPRADQLYIWDRVLFLDCQILGNSTTLTDDQKLARVSELLERFNKLPEARKVPDSTPPDPDSFDIKSRGLGVEGSCKRVRQSVDCALTIANLDKTQEIGFNQTQIIMYDAKSRAFHASQAVLAGNNNGRAKLLEKSSADALISFSNVPPEVVEIRRIEIPIYFFVIGNWASIVIETPIRIGA